MENSVGTPPGRPHLEMLLGDQRGRAGGRRPFAFEHESTVAVRCLNGARVGLCDSGGLLTLFSPFFAAGPSEC